jgi:iodotyrosine deiodinase
MAVALQPFRMTTPPFVPLDFHRRTEQDTLDRAHATYLEMHRRRTTRHFSTDPVPREAHQQPWTFVAVSDADLKRRMRGAAEEEEQRNYDERMPEEWLEALAPLGTDEHKPHLTEAPWIVVLFRQTYGMRADGSRRTHYYTQESCGIAAGFFIAAVHQMGLVTLTHTPTPMAFLGELLARPANEKAFLVMPVGYPATGAQVPDLARKPLADIAVWR